MKEEQVSQENPQDFKSRFLRILSDPQINTKIVDSLDLNASINDDGVLEYHTMFDGKNIWHSIREKDLETARDLYLGMVIESVMRICSNDKEVVSHEMGHVFPYCLFSAISLGIPYGYMKTLCEISAKYDENIPTSAAIDSAVYSYEILLKYFGERLSEEERRTIESKITDLEEKKRKLPKFNDIESSRLLFSEYNERKGGYYQEIKDKADFLFKDNKEEFLRIQEQNKFTLKEMNSVVAKNAGKSQ